MARFATLFLVIISIICGDAYTQNYAKFSNIEAGMKDWYLEQMAVRAANRRGSDIKCQEDFTKAVIVSDCWQVERNEHGNIVGRHLHMEVYGETPDGRCGVSHCVFRQRMLGDETYSTRLKLVEMGPFYALQCE